MLVILLHCIFTKKLIYYKTEGVFYIIFMFVRCALVFYM